MPAVSRAFGGAFLLACPAAAVAAAPDPQGAFLELVVNGVVGDPVLVILDGDDVLMAGVDLAAAGLASFGGQEVDFDGDMYISLASLAGSVRYQVDLATLRLELAVDPLLLPRTRLDLTTSTAPVGTVYTNHSSAFLNYGVRTVSAETIDGSAELGVTIRKTRAFSGVSFPWKSLPVRGLTQLTHDLRAPMVRLVFGDVFGEGGLLGGGAYVGGLQVARTFSLDPYFVPGPSLDHDATVMTPSTLEVYVNDRLVTREEVAPGPLELDRIPATSGAGDTRIVLRDEFGRETVVTARYYRPAALLAPGQHEFSYATGAQRLGIGVESFAYGAPAIVGVHRYGLSSKLTLGGRLEAAPDRLSLGGSVLGSTRVGQLELAAAESVGSEGQNGGAGSLAYGLSGQRVGASLFGRVQSPAYTTLSLAAADDRAVLDAGAALTVPFTSWVSTSFGGGYSAWRDGTPTQRASVSGGFQLPLHLQGSVIGSVLTEQGADPSWSLYVSLVRAVGRRTTVSARSATVDGVEQAGAEVAASHPTGPGIGYRVGAEAGEVDQAYGYVDGQTKFGLANLSYTWTPDLSYGVAGVAGGLVWIGGRAFASRPIDNAYALVRVPGVRQVHTYLNNNPIAATDGHGDALVVGLLPYYGNRLGISADDVPLDQRIDATDHLVAPPPHSGAIVVFPAHQLRVARGQIAIVGGNAAFGEIRIATDRGLLTSPLGRNAEFEMADVPPGTWAASVLYPGGRCTVEVALPNADPGILDLGILVCAAAGSPD